MLEQYLLYICNTFIIKAYSGGVNVVATLNVLVILHNKVQRLKAQLVGARLKKRWNNTQNILHSESSSGGGDVGVGVGGVGGGGGDIGGG